MDKNYKVLKYNMNDDGDMGDEDLWDAVMRDVTPIKGREKTVRLPAPKKVSKASKVVQAAEKPASSRTVPQGHDVDRNTLKRFQKGQMPIEARLDLHGMNQGQAHEALRAFIAASYAAGRRCVIVITGKGLTGKTSEEWGNAKPGVLKQRVPEWLEDAALKPYILQISKAQRKDGGDGALYVLLRRKRG